MIKFVPIKANKTDKEFIQVEVYLNNQGPLAVLYISSLPTDYQNDLKSGMTLGASLREWKHLIK